MQMVKGSLKLIVVVPTGHDSGSAKINAHFDLDKLAHLQFSNQANGTPGVISADFQISAPVDRLASNFEREIAASP